MDRELINCEAGSTTIELLVALAVGTIMLSAAVLVAFGGQTGSLDGGLVAEGLNRATSDLTSAASNLSLGWNRFLGTSTQDDIYTKTSSVKDISPCVKLVDEKVLWSSEKNREQYVTLTTLVQNKLAAEILGKDCDPFPPHMWDNPLKIAEGYIADSGNATGIDVVGNFVYVTANPNAQNKKDFFIFKFDPELQTLTLFGSLDTDEAITEGLVAVDVAEGFAFVASASTTAQFQVIDVRDGARPTRVAFRQLKGLLPAPDGSYPGGFSIYYYNRRVYVGTKETAGPELHVFNVSNPENPVEIGGGVELFTNVNKIFVRDRYAYLATSDDTSELCIVDVSDPTNTTLFKDCEDTGLFYNVTSATGSKDGGALYLLGNTLYFGLNRATEATAVHDFYIFDVADAARVNLLGSKDFGIRINTSFTGIVVREHLAFVAFDNPTLGFQIWDISNPLQIKVAPACGNLSAENTTGLDMENNFIFTSHRVSPEVRIYYDQKTDCPF